MTKILILGSSGQLGTAIQQQADKWPDFDFHFTTEEDIDLLEAEKAEKLIASCNCIINAAAYTAVDKAEEEKELCFAINTHGPAQLSAIAGRHNVRMLHISTDYVFDGRKPTPYHEEDLPSPLCVYSESKYLGEKAVLENNPLSTIVRTSWLYSPWGHNFVKSIIRLGNEKDSLAMIYDQTGTPTFAPDLADAILMMISSNDKNDINGIWHYSNLGVASWYDFAWAVLKHLNISCDIKPIESHEYPLPAKRPFYSVMSKRKIQDAFSLKIPHWRESLEKMLAEYKF